VITVVEKAEQAQSQNTSLAVDGSRKQYLRTLYPSTSI
jgi:hypothetical protein